MVLVFAVAPTMDWVVLVEISAALIAQIQKFKVKHGWQIIMDKISYVKKESAEATKIYETK
jgi:hypothetical protein